MMPGPFDAIPEGKKAVMVDGKWVLVPLDDKNQEDAVILLEEERVKVSKLMEIIKQQTVEIERLKIQLLENKPEHKVKK